MQNMMGHWIRIWPGEELLGEVVAVRGEMLVLRGRDGLTFEVPMLEAHKLGERLAPRSKWRLTDAGEAATRRDLPLLGGPN